MAENKTRTNEEIGTMLASALNSVGYISDSEASLPYAIFTKGETKNLPKQYGYTGGDISMSFAMREPRGYIYVMYDSARFSVEEGRKIAQRLMHAPL